MTDKLGSYRVAHRARTPGSYNVTDRCANNRAEHSHEVTRFRERDMSRFKTRAQAQRFPDVRAAVCNLLNCGRHPVRASHYRDLRHRAFAGSIWAAAI